MYNWTFAVKDKEVFTTTEAWEQQKERQLNTTYKDSFFINETAELAKPNMARTELFTGYAVGPGENEESAASKIKYSMAFTDLGTNEIKFLNFFVNGEGEGLAKPRASGKYSGTLRATDAGGSTATLYTWEFEVKAQVKFDTTDEWKEVRNKTLGPTGGATEGRYLEAFVVGKTYTLVKPTLPNTSTPVFQGAQGHSGGAEENLEIKYAMTFSRPDGSTATLPFFTNGEGKTLAQPTANDTGTYEASLIATDKSGSSTAVYEWGFEVKAKETFDTSAGWKQAREQVLGESYRSNGTFAVGDNATLDAPQLPGTALVFEGFSGTRSQISYKMQFENISSSGENADLSFFVSTTGQALAQIRAQHVGNFRGSLLAIDAAGDTTTVYSWAFRIQYKDTDVDAYGPNGRGCNGGNMVDRTPFDQKYTCDCSDVTNQGANCDVPPTGAAGSAAAGSDEMTLYAVVAALAVILVAALVFVAVAKRRAYVNAWAAMDFETQLQMLKDAGLIDPNSTGDEGPLLPRELRRAWLNMISELGKGAFGEVWKCTLTDMANNVPEYLVAAKIVKIGGCGNAMLQSVATHDATRASAEEELLNEALLMRQVGVHKNLVSLIGVVTRGTPKMIVISFCEHGELLVALKKKVADGTPFEDKPRLYCEIAEGMAHLASHKLIHRDLAARNVLLGSGWVCKASPHRCSVPVCLLVLTSHPATCCTHACCHAQGGATIGMLNNAELGLCRACVVLFVCWHPGGRLWPQPQRQGGGRGRRLLPQLFGHPPRALDRARRPHGAKIHVGLGRLELRHDVHRDRHRRRPPLAGHAQQPGGDGHGAGRRGPPAPGEL